MTIRDEFNKFEKLKMKESDAKWNVFRDCRTHMSHEYIINPERKANYLNMVCQLTKSVNFGLFE